MRPANIRRTSAGCRVFATFFYNAPTAQLYDFVDADPLVAYSVVFNSPRSVNEKLIAIEDCQVSFTHILEYMIALPAKIPPSSGPLCVAR
jgi:hypothetical protein